MADKEDNFIVAVRVRPMNAREKEAQSKNVIRVIDGNVIFFDPKSDAGDDFMNSARKKKRNFGERREKDIRMQFDRVFDFDSSQDEVYENTAKRLVQSVLEGYNASCFAYGTIDLLFL